MDYNSLTPTAFWWIMNHTAQKEMKILTEETAEPGCSTVDVSWVHAPWIILIVSFMFWLIIFTSSKGPGSKESKEVVSLPRASCWEMYSSTFWEMSWTRARSCWALGRDILLPSKGAPIELLYVDESSFYFKFHCERWLDDGLRGTDNVTYQAPHLAPDLNLDVQR